MIEVHSMEVMQRAIRITQLRLRCIGMEFMRIYRIDLFALINFACDVNGYIPCPYCDKNMHCSD